jgi:hypothetical protein
MCEKETVMEKATIDATRSISLSDVKEIAMVEGPCLTIAVPIQPAENTSRQDYMRFKSAAHSAEPALSARGLKAREIREFLDPIAHIDAESLGTDFGSLVVLRSPTYFRYFQVREQVKDTAIVADHFQILPYLRAIQDEQRHFYILALSQRHVRLLRCTNHSSEEIPFGPDTPTSVEQWLNTHMPTTAPDHGAVQPSATGSTAGSFTSELDRDTLGSHIANFYHKINTAVFEALRGEAAPLVLAGVEYEVSMYRNINTYPHLADQHVQGSPDSLKGGELHKRALEVVKEAFEAPLRKALAMYERLGGTERVSSKPVDVVKAAGESRVSHLFIAEGASHPGGRSGEDLLNIAALQTIANGGEVWITPGPNVPGHGPVAALLRY